MSATSPASGPDDTDVGTWASESLPMSVRKELLERELSKLGFRKAAAQGSPGHDGRNAQQDGGAGSSHPRADATSSAERAG